MRMYNIKRNNEKHNSIILSKDTAWRLNIQRLEYITLIHGCLAEKTLITISKELDKSTISISGDVIDRFRLQTNGKYELQRKDNNIIIGPLIGILAAGSKRGLKRKKSGLSRYVHFYEQIGGSLIAFSLAGFNKNDSLVHGYLYDPDSNTRKKGVYPFPQAVFNRIKLRKKWRNYLESMIGDKFFNSYYCDKWKVHQLLYLNEEIRHHIPKTSLYQTSEDIYGFLKQHPTVYIKPIRGSLGKGIYQLSKTKIGYVVRTRKRSGNVVKNFRTSNQVNNYLLKKLKRNNYVLQEALDLAFNRKVHDFRLIMVKDQAGNWRDLGLLGKYGPENSVVSNWSNGDGGNIEVGEKTLKRLFNLTDNEAETIRKKMADMAILAAKELDSYYHYGNFGVDIGIDRDKNIWILEMNNRDPHHHGAGGAERWDIVYNACLSNMLYAKKLTGFNKNAD